MESHSSWASQTVLVGLVHQAQPSPLILTDVGILELNNGFAIFFKTPWALQLSSFNLDLKVETLASNLFLRVAEVSTFNWGTNSIN